ncbi:membrane stabilizing protein MspA [Mammaliicoccus fleurettii]|uniref:Membrane stabilizing protein MspA n=1 Tax=Mammaliicoccus fleurettii TaxID=150056 RepID=A0ABS5MKY6_9STAP|nr:MULTISPECIES: membrane stabilizing protein MspA [Mammaliicoccus]MBL0846413.1 membrane stabilizing protein MspA [Mammaliicoccus fleurettii]MBS3671489.1 membrane stabilizing protein MspA [Mammaliicoccus fleurettii]MBS3696556.1 membrane stabilizing protein MspA [Mammaliicoccus fleurettii]MEB6200987.1 membrane stabilizing protein MspA [Mammaliicoccus fleurettii]MEB8068047.1 membrane stabilizing protein MspA [Mammaliicoccus fleurettii]
MLILILLLFTFTYLIISYLSIYQLHTMLTQALRFIMGLMLIVFLGSIVFGFSIQIWWIVAVLVCLVINIEITAFKYRIKDKKATKLLNYMTIFILIIYVILLFITF